MDGVHLDRSKNPGVPCQAWRMEDGPADRHTGLAIPTHYKAEHEQVGAHQSSIGFDFPGTMGSGPAYSYSSRRTTSSVGMLWGREVTRQRDGGAHPKSARELEKESTLSTIVA